MNALMTRKLITGVLALIIAFPFLIVTDDEHSEGIFVDTVSHFALYSAEFNVTVDAFVHHAPRPVLLLGVCDRVKWSAAGALGAGAPPPPLPGGAAGPDAGDIAGVSAPQAVSSNPWGRLSDTLE